MRRLFWVAVGAAGGVWVYQRGGEALDRARDRGVIGNIAVATATAGKVATTATHVIAVAAEQGARAAGKVAQRSDKPDSAEQRPSTGTKATRPPEGHAADGLR
ncbi:MAG: hypothetical protein ABI468_07315 [Candidatus Nanopelagicales bacterium]